MYRALAPILALLLAAPAALALEISDPWTPEAPPGRMMAGFMSIHNPGPEAVRLVDAASPQFGHVEIHTMSLEAGVMRMRRLDQLLVPAGETVVLEPGGLHLMLIEPLASFGAGDKLDIRLIDAEGRQFQLWSEVRPRQRPAFP